jgi:Trypsin-co-occurring domain 2
VAEALDLADVIKSLREELNEAMVDAAGKVIQFELGPIDLEFQVVVSREAGGSGKIRFWVVELGGEGKMSSASTQVIKLQLTPKDVVTGRSPLVAGAAGQLGGVGQPPVTPNIPQPSNG